MAMTFGDKLRVIRAVRKLDQADVARLANMHPSLISMFEVGERIPSAITQERIRQALGWPKSGDKWIAKLEAMK